MGLFSRSRDKPRRVKNKDIAGGAFSGRSFLFGNSVSGKTVNEYTAVQITAVYACVKVLAETVASLPLHLYRINGDKKEKAKEHPLYKLLYGEPNQEMTSFVFREVMMGHLLLWGNAYSQVIRNGRGEVVALYPLLPDRMKVDRSDKGEIYYTYRTNKGEVTLPWHEVLHIFGLGFDGLIGYSPIAMAKNAIGMAIATEEFGSKFFSNGATPSAVLEHPGVVKDPARIRDNWNAVYQGSSNSHKTAILEEGMKYQRIGIPPEEAQFLQTRKFQMAEICRLFRVPPHMVGDLDRATFGNIEHQSIEFVVHTIRPWLVRWEQSLNRILLRKEEKSDYYFSFNVDGLLRGDYTSRMSGYAIGRQNGFLSINDIRSLENMNPIPAELGGDLYLVNGGLMGLAVEKSEGEDTKTNGKKDNSKK